MKPDGASMVLGPFAGTKGPRLPGRNPATQKITWAREWGNTPAMRSPAHTFYWQTQRGIPHTHNKSCKAKTMNSV
jgi:hypothetical protein